MVRFFLYSIVAVIVLIIGAFSAYRMFPDFFYQAAFVPPIEYVEPEKVELSAYAQKSMWFSRPDIAEKQNPALWRPDGYQLAEDPKASVFFIHPTSYLGREYWNAPVDDPESRARAAIFIRGEASVFNGIADIWAPRYRQAAFGAFLTDAPEARMALNAAYRDVEAAFDEFIKSIPEDRPIILAGHSQGSLHLTHLLANRIAGTPLAKRVVAAYVVGWPISLSQDIDELGLPGCEEPEQSGCIMSWQSFAEPAGPEKILKVYDASTGFNGELRAGSDMLCTNPITGRRDDVALADANIGALRPNEKLNDGELIAGTIPARCGERGFLMIGSPPDMGPGVLPGNNYHVYDYPLFWANIRIDAARRLASWLGVEYVPEIIDTSGEGDLMETHIAGEGDDKAQGDDVRSAGRKPLPGREGQARPAMRAGSAGQ